MDYEYAVDIVCQVFAGEKSLEKVRGVLERFLPFYEPLDLEYTFKPDDEDYIFGSEDEMVRYFIDTPGLKQTFYWNSNRENPDRIMVGAVITADDQLIISLTVDGTTETEKKYFNELKQFLQSEIGVVSYSDPAPYRDGTDFCSRYGSKAGFL